jgi:hypothetical protein
MTRPMTIVGDGHVAGILGYFGWFSEFAYAVLEILILYASVV